MVVDYVVGLEERTMFEGFCPLEYDTTNHWVTIFSFNVSNDGSRFTENFHVYTYQSLCQEYRNDTGNITFVFKVRTLFPKTNIYRFNNIRASVSKNQLILKDNVVCDTEFVFP